MDAVTVSHPGRHAHRADRGVAAPRTTGRLRQAVRHGRADAARQTIELAEREGVLLSPYQNRRWDSDLLTIRRLLDAGSLGELRRFESAFERWAPQPEPRPAGGGLLRDFGSHLVDQALHLFGPVHRVYAETHEVESGVRGRLPAAVATHQWDALPPGRGVAAERAGAPLPVDRE